MWLAILFVLVASLMTGFAYFLSPMNAQNGLLGAKTVAEQMMVLHQQALQRIATQQPAVTASSAGTPLDVGTLAPPAGNQIPGWDPTTISADYRCAFYTYNLSQILVTYATRVDANDANNLKLGIGVDAGAVARELRIATDYDPGVGITSQGGSTGTVLRTQQQIASKPSNLDPSRGGNPMTAAPTSISVPLPSGIPAGVPILVTYVRR